MGICIYDEDGNCTSNMDYIGNLEKENKLIKENNEKLIKLTGIAYNALLGLRGDAREFGFELSPKTLDLMKLLSDLINTKESEDE